MRLNIFVGHFGSGKTTVALNHCLMSNSQNRIMIDMDTVNAYYRAADAKQLLAQNNIKLIAPQFANTNADLPTLPSDILTAFADKHSVCVFDVGGDEDGAYALGVYSRYFLNQGYEMFLVANCCRPFTRTAEEIAHYATQIQIASRLKITGIINNTHLMNLTTADLVNQGCETVKQACGLLDVPFKYNAVRHEFSQGVLPPVEIISLEQKWSE